MVTAATKTTPLPSSSASSSGRGPRSVLGRRLPTPPPPGVQRCEVRRESELPPPLQAPRKLSGLILPVVICLSQRLSHACLSTDLYTVKLRMAH